MTDEREDLAVRAVLARRQPVTIPYGLVERLERVPDEVKPLPAFPIRVAVSVIPWAAIVAIALVFVAGPGFNGTTAPVGTTPDAAWDPASPGGGFADVGPFGLPWVPALPILMLLGGLWVAGRVRSGKSLAPNMRLGRPEFKRKMTLADVGLFTFLLALNLLVWAVVRRDWDVLTIGSVSGAGAGLSDVRSDGGWLDETNEDYMGIHSGDRFVYRVRPNEPFTYLVSARNTGPVPVTVLGRPRDPGVPVASTLPGTDYAPTGLGLLRDPNVISALPADVVPFHPVRLGPGEEVTIVVASIGGDCADPTASVLVRPRNVEAAYSVPLLFEVFGWRQNGDIWPPFQVTVPTKPGCMPADSFR